MLGLTDHAHGYRLIGHSDLDAQGDGMMIAAKGHYLFVGHVGDSRVGTSIVDISVPNAPRVVRQLKSPPGTHTHKVQVVGDVLVVNHERNMHERPIPFEWSAGIKTYDISDPENPTELGFLGVKGKGVHRMVYTDEPYAYMSASDYGFVGDFFMIADLSDPANPREVGRWWFPGQNILAEEIPAWDPGVRTFRHHHAGIRGDRAYATWWDGGLVILDISDRTAPKFISWLDFGKDEGAATHTAVPIPGRDLLAVCGESLKAPGHEVPRRVRLVDISDETNPVVLSSCPIPAGDFAERPGRFGPHNIHDMRPGSFVSSDLIHVTYFNAGLRTYDISDPHEPRELGSFVPRAAPGSKMVAINDLYVTPEGWVYLTDRFGGGLYILAPE